MSYEMKEGEIVLFKNKNKEGKQPDMKGKCMINGNAYWVAMWAREKDGVRYLKGKLEEPRSDFSTRENAPTPQPETSDDLPF